MINIQRVSKSFQKNLNFRFLLMFMISVFCLLFMHWQLALTIEYEYPFKIDAIFSNVLSCFFDVSFFFFLGLLLTRGRVKHSLLITFVLSSLLSFCNVLYSRFFGHYLPNLAILQIGNMNDSGVMGSVLTGFRWQDLFYLFLTLLFGWLYIRNDKVKLKEKYLSTLGWLWGTMLAGVMLFILVLGIFHDHNFETSFIRFSPIKVQYTQAPNNMLYRSGFVRRMLVCYADFMQKDLTLDDNQKKEIEQAYMDYSQRTTAEPTVGERMNLIFIIVESYMSVTSDLKVDGKEITPFMNRLKRDSSVYYNGHVRPNVNLGESSDGQFIYMTGLLPLKSEITVNIAKDKTFCGLPATLMKTGRVQETHIIVPTSPTFWEQDKMNGCYGIENMSSKFDCDKALHGSEDLNDEQVFTMASKVEATAEQPFFSLVVTMSMHNPYNKCVEHGFNIADKDLTPEYLNYLVDCHYTDSQIERYIEGLKQSGLYDNSVIVITADHDAHPVHLNVEEKAISNELPLYIIHGGIDPTKAWTGPCRQLDIYTTLLDLFGIETKWRGLGHTLLNADYKEYPIEKVQTLSDWIIRSDYFKTR